MARLGVRLSVGLAALMGGAIMQFSAESARADGGLLAGGATGVLDSATETVGDIVGQPPASSTDPVAPPEQPRPAIEPVAETVSSALEPVAEPLVPLVETIEPVVETIVPVVDPIVETVAPAVETVTPVLDPVLAPLTPIVETVAPVLGPVLEPLTPIVETVAPVLEPVFEPLTPTVGTIAPALEPVLERLTPIIETVAPTLEPALEPLTPILETVAPLTDPVVGPVMDALGPASPLLDPVFGGDAGRALPPEPRPADNTPAPAQGLPAVPVAPLARDAWDTPAPVLELPTALPGSSGSLTPGRTHPALRDTIQSTGTSGSHGRFFSAPEAAGLSFSRAVAIANGVTGFMTSSFTGGPALSACLGSLILLAFLHRWGTRVLRGTSRFPLLAYEPFVPPA